MSRPISYDPDEALQLALELFWKRGYRDVSIDDLTSGTGLNRHSLYGRYRSKYGLAESVLRRYCEIGTRSLRELLRGPGSPTQRLRDFLNLRDPSCADPYWRSMLDRGCLAVRMLHEMKDTHPEIGAIVAQVSADVAHELTAVVREGQQLGEIRGDAPAEQLAMLVYSAWSAAPMMPEELRRVAVKSALN